MSDEGACLPALPHRASTSRHWTQMEHHTAALPSAGFLGRQLLLASWQRRHSGGTGAVAARHHVTISLHCL